MVLFSYLGKFVLLYSMYCIVELQVVNCIILFQIDESLSFIHTVSNVLYLMHEVVTPMKWTSPLSEHPH
jgi:hypothetical protein